MIASFPPTTPTPEKSLLTSQVLCQHHCRHAEGLTLHVTQLTNQHLTSRRNLADHLRGYNTTAQHSTGRHSRAAQHMSNNTQYCYAAQ